MKTFRYALIFVAVAGLTNGLIAKTEKKVTKKHEVTKKHATPKATPKKYVATKKHTPVKTQHKTATKAVTPKAAVKKSAPVQTQAAAKPTESTTSKIVKYFGLGAASSAATTAAAGHTVHHRGPANFDKRHIPHDWKEGFTGKWVGDKWLFAGRDLAWWHANYPAYYRDVVRPEATKAGVPRQHFAHELIKRK